MDKKRIISVILVFFVGVAGLLFYFDRKDSSSAVVMKDDCNEDGSSGVERESESDGQDKQCSDDDKDKKSSIFVHVCGEVNKPGVYEVGSNSRVVNVIKVAGGLTKDAAGDNINQALLVSDGQHVYIPSKKEIKDGNIFNSITINDNDENDCNDIVSSKDGNSNKININTADKQQLMSIPGVGAVRADRIIEYRNQNGKFSTIDDIKNVKGIKDGLFSKISSYITVK